MIEETGSTVRTPPPAPEPSGRRYWRSLEELEEPGALDELVRREFPQGAELWTDEIGRRNFLKLMAASLGLWGWTGCTKQPEEKIVPYVVPPEQVIPGKPLTFASAISLGGYGRGVLVESHQGRPTKIEGNPDHPASLGAADALTQASVLTLWDPDRAQVVSQGGSISTWGSFLTAWGAQASRLRESRGRGLRLLTETVT